MKIRICFGFRYSDFGFMNFNDSLPLQYSADPFFNPPHSLPSSANPLQETTQKNDEAAIGRFPETLLEKPDLDPRCFRWRGPLLHPSSKENQTGSP